MKPGDIVVITDVNHPPMRRPVAKVTKKTIYIGTPPGRLSAFDITTRVEKDEMGHRRLYTLEEYARIGARAEARLALLNFGISIGPRIDHEAVIDIHQALIPVIDKWTKK